MLLSLYSNSYYLYSTQYIVDDSSYVAMKWIINFKRETLEGGNIGGFGELP